MDQLEKMGRSGNLVWLVGHNSLRTLAGVCGEEVTEEQYQIMEAALRQALEDGAVGMSSGLEFEPGRMSRPEELMRLAGVVKEYDAIYTSHIRNRDARVLDALDEFLAVIRHWNIRGEVSHMNIRYHTHAPEHAVQKCMEKIQQARDEGYEVLTDMTPLNYGIGQMAGILPGWLTGLPREQLKSALLDPEIRSRLKEDCDRYWRFIAGGEWERVRMQNNYAFPEINGMTFPEIANLWHKDPWDCYFDILAAVAPDIESVYAGCGWVQHVRGRRGGQAHTVPPSLYRDELVFNAPCEGKSYSQLGRGNSEDDQYAGCTFWDKRPGDFV